MVQLDSAGTVIPGLSAWGVVFIVAGAAILLAIFAGVVLLIHNSQIRREWEHAERMKAVEMGHALPARDASWARAWVCISIGAGVPLVAFVLTFIAHERPGTADEIFVAPAIVSVLSVISSAVLGGFLFHKPTSADRELASNRDGSTGSPVLDRKQAADPDAIDVVGRRG
jgi:hypothetical protein